MTWPSQRRRALALVSILLCATVLLARSAGTALITEVPLADPDAILVLGSHEWERLPTAAALARADSEALIFLSVPKTPTIYNCHDCEGRPRRLMAAGVAADRIVLLPQKVANTREEAASARLECERRQLRRLLVVTSPYHTRRAWATFQQAFAGSGIAVGIIPSNASPARPQRWWETPYDRAYVRYEWAGIVYYYLLGSI